MRKSLFVLLAVLVIGGGAGVAQADYSVWRDAETGMSLSFPDTWRIVSNAAPDDVVTFMAPAGRGNAQCRMRIRGDRRYVIYPSRYDSAIQKIDFSYDYWERYLGAYDDAKIFNVQNGAGLGRGFAGYAQASYKSTVPGPYMDRRGLMFASLYNDKVYILECSAHEEAFGDWKGAFLSVAGSVDFKKTHHQIMTGHYRNFMGEGRLMLRSVDGSRVEHY